MALPALIPLLVACAAWARTPEETVREYLEAGSRDDLPTAQALVEERCLTGPEGRVAVVRVLGAPMTLESLVVTEQERQGDRTSVQYTARGKVDARDATTEITLFGVQAQVQVGELKVEELERSGTLPLVKVAGSWKISCPRPEVP
jgi:hypothetical protein